MAAVKEVELIVPQGTTFIYEVTYVHPNDGAVHLGGYTARLQVRETIASTDVIYEATTENGHITIDGSHGRVTLKVPAAVTELWDFKKAVFDLEIESATGEVTRLVKGTMELDLEVTR
jgi:hypothetical protein